MVGQERCWLQLWCHPMGLQPLLCSLPSLGWFMVTVSPPAKTMATAWLRSPVMQEAAATCEIRAWYHLSGSGEGAHVGHRRASGYQAQESDDGEQWGGMGPSAPMAGTEPPAPQHGSLPSCSPLPCSASRAGGTQGSRLWSPELVGHSSSLCPVPRAMFWGSPQGSTRRSGRC